MSKNKQKNPRKSKDKKQIYSFFQSDRQHELWRNLDQGFLWKEFSFPTMTKKLFLSGTVKVFPVSILLQILLYITRKSASFIHWHFLSRWARNLNSNKSEKSSIKTWILNIFSVIRPSQTSEHSDICLKTIY